eukprot:TRINITY_DN1404_c0_g1_i1.p1 TRINITY_DN1404_c0_g1~~TRINITY_DN1404_c0_g1_i1.p1  ORF type:complete len:264 (+),score=116.58 TRINITY_DN1404_c0_g1_i1:64-855(+)
MPPYKLEYAKSGRAKCQGPQCKETIAKGELRVGTGMMLPGMEEYTFKWRHVCCFTKRQLKAATSTDQFEGYDELAEKDQQMIKDMLEGKYVDDRSIIGKTGKASEEAPASPKKKAAAKKKRADDDAGDGDGEKPAKKAKAAAKPAAKETKAAAKPAAKETKAAAKKEEPKAVEKKAAVKKAEAKPAEAKKAAKPAPKKPKKKTVQDETSSETSSTSSDSSSSSSSSSSTSSASSGTREECKYGAKCFRLNPEHLAKYKHPPKA